MALYKRRRIPRWFLVAQTSLFVLRFGPSFHVQDRREPAAFMLIKPSLNDPTLIEDKVSARWLKLRRLENCSPSSTHRSLHNNVCVLEQHLGQWVWPFVVFFSCLFSLFSKPHLSWIPTNMTLDSSQNPSVTEAVAREQESLRLARLAAYMNTRRCDEPINAAMQAPVNTTTSERGANLNRILQRNDAAFHSRPSHQPHTGSSNPQSN